MQQTAKFRVGPLPESIGAGRLIKLPYGKRDSSSSSSDGTLVSMYVVLPDEGTQLKDLKLDQMDLEEIGSYPTCTLSSISRHLGHDHEA